MDHIEIRLKRLRTPDSLGFWEIVEKWAKMEGRLMPNALEHLINGNPIFREFAAEQRNPGRETT